MQRRSAIKNLMIIAGGIAILPSCAKDKEKGKASIQLENLDIDAEQEKLLAEVSEAFIPATDTPGAKALNLHLFVLKMVDDCHDKADQEKFVAGLNQVDKISKKHFDKSFINCTTIEREEILKNIENIKDPSEVSQFYKIAKDRTIQGYLNSKYVMTELVPYELVPGRYNGYFPVKKS